MAVRKSGRGQTTRRKKYALVEIKKLSPYERKIRKKKFKAVFEDLETFRKKTVYFGGHGYNDYTIYYKAKGKQKADEHKERYLARHKVNENWKDPMLPGTLSRYILWNKPTITASIKNYKDTFFKNNKYITK